MGVHYFTLRLKTPRTALKVRITLEHCLFLAFTFNSLRLMKSFGWGSPEVRLPSTGHHHPAADFLECQRVLL